MPPNGLTCELVIKEVNHSTVYFITLLFTHYMISSKIACPSLTIVKGSGLTQTIPKVSAVMITFNESHNIRRTLSKLK